MPPSNPSIGRENKDRSPAGIRAFTLIELLVVVAIMVAMYALVVPAITGIKGASDLTSAAYQIKGALELGRTYAVSNNTYTWVGFFEQNIANTTATPAASGTGQLVISIVASNDGTSIYNKTQASTTGGTQNLPASRLVQVNKLIKLGSVHVFDATSITVGARPAKTISTSYLAGLSPTSSSPLFSFPYPLVSGTVYTFGASSSRPAPPMNGIVQFDPQGEAISECGPMTGPAPSYEIAIQATHGTAIASSSNIIALDVSGLTGEVTMYRR
jgi:prepilin-type N-terminal cleavage/methylation domain-containing protein